MKTGIPEEFKSLQGISGLVLDMRYASDNNVLGYDLYQGFDGAMLHRIAQEKLVDACQYMSSHYPDYNLLLLDATRPPRAQQLLWDYVEGTDMEDYVANPSKGSVHSFGFAVDVTLSLHGREVDMGTEFDSFQRLAQPRFEQEMLDSGRLTPSQHHNREILRDIMTHGGFIPFALEWWHFDALPPGEVRQNYNIVI